MSFALVLKKTSWYRRRYSRPIRVKSVLLLSGTPAENFSSHLFRIGAATTAAHKGLSQQQIQALGRWSSEAFKSYIRSDRSPHQGSSSNPNQPTPLMTIYP